jgi:YegS/Rv2252/BmrU family lipid kinase
MEQKQALDEKIKSQRTAVLVVNTQSRKGAKLFPKVVAELGRRGIELVATYQVSQARHLPEIMQEAVQKASGLVIVGGGDGTISSVVDKIAYQKVVLGILPLGTGNSFARTLGIPLSIAGAVDVIVNGKVADVDLGKINNDYFANMAAVGFTADVAHKTSDGVKAWLGPLAYLYIALKEFVHHQPFSCVLRFPHDQQRLQTHQVFIANGSFTGKTWLTPTIDPDNGKLVVFTMPMHNRWALIKLLLAFLLGRYRAFAQAQYYSTKAVVIESEPRQTLDVDGEKSAQTPVTIAIAREALKVMVPQSFCDE